MKLTIHAHQIRPGDLISNEPFDFGPLIVRNVWRTETGHIAIVVDDGEGNEERGYHEADAALVVEREPTSYEVKPSVFEVIGDISETTGRLSASLRMWQVRDLPGAPPKADHAAQASIDIIDVFTATLGRLRVRLVEENAMHQARKNAEVDDLLGALADDFGDAT